MAAIVNERDVLIRSAPTRVVDYDLPPNVLVPALKGLSLTSPGTIFRIANNGDVSPTGITLTVNLRGLPEDTPVAWEVTYGALNAPITATGLTYTLAASNMASDVVTIEAYVVSGGFTYRDGVTFARIQDGSLGLPGSRGSLTAARAIAGSVWTDAEAVQALRDYGLPEPVAPIAGDLVTLYNYAARFVQMRRFDGDSWEIEAPSFPGTNIFPGTVATEQLLVTGMAEALNSDPNTQDITAWSGNGISIVSDSSAPNGVSALRCAGQGTTVLSRRFPINAVDNYQVRMWAKQESGSSTCYLVVAFYDASNNLITGTSAPAGWTSVGTHHYFGRVNEAPPATWTQYTVDFGQDETFKVPTGARYASIGIISNFLAPGEQRVCGAVCRRKVDGRVTVDGSIAARHIDARGLTIRNPAGQILLDANDDAPPWVVSLENRADAGALYLASTRDALNKAQIRGIRVDQVALKGGYSASGASVELTPTATEVWRCTYSGALSIFVEDNEVDLDHSTFQMEPDVAYMFEFRLVCTANAGTAGTLQVRLDIPAGCNVTLQDGTSITGATAGPVTLGTLSAAVGAPNLHSPQSLKVFVKAGAGGGQVRLKVRAFTAAARLNLGTQFIGNRLAQYVQPAVLTSPAATLVAPMTSNVIAPTSVSTPAGQPYNAYFELDSFFAGTKVTGPFFPLWLYGLNLLRRSGSSSVMLAMYVADSGSKSGVVRLSTFNLSETGSISGSTSESRGALLAFDVLSNVPAEEYPRWGVQSSWQVVQVVPSDDIDPYFLTGSGSSGVSSQGVSSSSTLSGVVNAFNAIPAPGAVSFELTCNNRVPGFIIVDLTAQLTYAGVPQGSPWKVRMRINRA